MRGLRGLATGITLLPPPRIPMSADDENEEAKKKARAERFQYTEEATNSGEYDQDDQMIKAVGGSGGSWGDENSRW